MGYPLHDMKTLIKGAGGSTKGFVIESGDKKEIFSPEGKRLGYYLKSVDKTFTASGSCIGFGDQTMALLVS